MKKINIVITMGGLGSRFRKAGYSMPKFMIEAKGKTLFDWSMLSLEGYRAAAKKYIFLVKEDSDFDVQQFIKEHCRLLNISNYDIVLIDHLTDGQATTAMLAKPFIDLDDGMLIYNIDTYVEPGAMNDSELKGDGFIPCFEGEGDHWSFVLLDAEGKAAEVREKQRISKYCTLGAYYFKSGALYEKLYNEYYSDPGNIVNGEKYVAPLYNYLIQKGGEVYISNVNKKCVHVLGTPGELKEFIVKD